MLWDRERDGQEAVWIGESKKKMRESENVCVRERVIWESVLSWKPKRDNLKKYFSENWKPERDRVTQVGGSHL